MALMRCRPVLINSREPSLPITAPMHSDTLCLEVSFDSLHSHPDIYRFSDKQIGNTVEVAVNFYVVIDVDSRFLPLGVLISLQRETP